MTKAEFMKRMAARSGVSQGTCQNVIDALLGELTDAMTSGDIVRFQGFGAFSSKEHAARQGYNLNTGERCNIPARRIPFFKASEELKKIVGEDAL